MIRNRTTKESFTIQNKKQSFWIKRRKSYYQSQGLWTGNRLEQIKNYNRINQLFNSYLKRKINWLGRQRQIKIDIIRYWNRILNRWGQKGRRREWVGSRRRKEKRGKRGKRERGREWRRKGKRGIEGKEIEWRKRHRYYIGKESVIG